MSGHNNETCRTRNVAALAVWENEGGASGRDFYGPSNGRRVEVDRSWTDFHVFSGSPARKDGDAMTGLSRSDATSSMLSLNLRNVERRKARAAAAPIVLHERTASQS